MRLSKVGGDGARCVGMVGGLGLRGYTETIRAAGLGLAVRVWGPDARCSALGFEGRLDEREARSARYRASASLNLI